MKKSELHTQIYQNKTVRIISHLFFWLIIYLFLLFFFGKGTLHLGATYLFTAILLPLAIGVTYFFNYYLFPEYLHKKNYGRFILLSFYTILASFWLALLIEISAILWMLQYKTFPLDPRSLDPMLQIVGIYFTIFLAIVIKQVKRAFIIQQQNAELEKIKISTSLKLKEAELKLLKAQIHPHFLFNTLNNIYGLTLEKSDKAPGLVLHLAEILDYILYRCDKPRIPLSEEIGSIRNYIEIEKIRYTSKLELAESFPGNTGDLKIAPLILIPFVENAFKHGVNANHRDPFISIKCILTGNKLNFQIMNSKDENSMVPEHQNRGVGLKNVEKRLELIYTGKYSLNIVDEKQFYSVNLILELET